jgi:hypothetical protein
MTRAENHAGSRVHSQSQYCVIEADVGSIDRPDKTWEVAWEEAASCGRVWRVWRVCRVSFPPHPKVYVFFKKTKTPKDRAKAHPGNLPTPPELTSESRRFHLPNQILHRHSAPLYETLRTGATIQTAMLRFWCQLWITLLLFPGIIRWINVRDSPRPHSVYLHNCFLFRPAKMVGLGRDDGNTACWQCLGFCGIELVPNAHI